MRLLKIRNFWTKLTAWEYWPWYIVYIPVFAYWLYLGVRAGAIFFFSAANPAIKYGGLISASKKKILDLLPKELIPLTFLLKAPVTISHIEEVMKTSGMQFPIILKPDLGERGWKVEKINGRAEAAKYLNESTGDILVQEYLDLPFEAGVFYYRVPRQNKGVVSSVVLKELLFVEGDGLSTLEELIIKKPRARIQYYKLQNAWEEKFDYVPEKGERIELQPIGNHNRGTAFLNGCHLIDEELTNTFDVVSKQIDGFYYGRFDVRCKDVNALKTGDIKIMELNGAASEPAHIYHPGYSILKAYRAFFHHWKMLYRISKANHKKGVPYLKFKEGLHALSISGRLADQGL
ncbi:MAG: hypothetical protein KDC79_01740 [Cyclobacteriaceae bacterium]|nr:hypothetical protein [Cyclobacteriaceae bacterium]